MEKMKFEQLMTFWELRKMIKHHLRFSNDPVYDSQHFHEIYTCEVHAGGDENIHARIIYRRDQAPTTSKLALIYADIIFKGAGYQLSDDETDQIINKNTKVGDLIR